MQQLLPETDSVMEVILRPAFAIAFATTTTIMLAGNYVMEKSSIEKTSAPARLVHPDLYINVLSNAFFLSIMTFANSYQVTRTVATGASPPIKASRLERMWFPLNVICGRHGDRSMASFVIQMVCFAGLGTLAALHVISFIVNGPENAMNWVMPLHTYMGCCMLWKLSITATIFTLNYIAAHNPTQSIFIPTQDSDAVAPNEEPAVAQQRSSEKKNQ